MTEARPSAYPFAAAQAVWRLEKGWRLVTDSIRTYSIWRALLNEIIAQAGESQMNQGNRCFWICVVFPLSCPLLSSI